VIQGRPIRELPPERPRNVALVVNMSAATALDIEIPFGILSITSRLVR
jgi:ABC-type uncharacterized transport system substrate-binding protein